MAGRMKSFLIIFLIISTFMISFAVELELLSHPQSADVYIDKVWRGHTPITVDLSPGNHTVHVQKNGYQQKEETIDIRMPTVMEYNLNPLEEITEQFPLVLYLTNYQQSGSRKILFRENEDQLIQAIQDRFSNMGFEVSVEKPLDEFDLVMDNLSIYEMLSERHPQARLFLIANALWSYSSFQEKKITRLETQMRIYDPKTSITLGNFQDISESIGMLGTQINILQAVEKATQRFLDNIGNYMVERVRKDIKRPILAYDQKYQNGQLYLIKSDQTINEIKSYDKTESLIDSEQIPMDQLPVNIIFLVDRSGSNNREIPLIKSQIESLLQILPKGFEWSLMGFDDKIEIIQNFTGDYIQWQFAKDQIISSGMTRLYDAIFNAATVLARKEGVKILILLTDGIDSDYYDTGLGSIRTEEEALNAISRSGMIVYPIGVSENNHTSLLNKIAYLSATQYYDLKQYQPDEVSTQIARDLTYTLGNIIISGKEKPEYYSINGYKYSQEANSRFLNQASLIREFQQIGSESNQLETQKAVEEMATIEQSEETPLTQTDTEQQAITTISKESTTTASEEIPIETVEKKEPVTKEQSETAVEIPVEEPEKVPVTTSKATSSTDETKEQSIEKQTEEVQTISNEADTETIVEFPNEYKQILNLQDVSIFDLDMQGNLVWAQNDLLYFYIPAENRIAGISLSTGIRQVSLHYPYLTVLFNNELKTLTIKKDQIIEISSSPISLPIAYLKMLNDQFIVMGYENGLMQLYSLEHSKINEWQLESGVLNQAVVDDSGRIIASTTTGRINWIENTAEGINSLKIDKPVVGLSPFDVDQERFLIVDASGSVYFQRFENTKPTIRNLNRGIVLMAAFAESNNMLFANHWDKTLRGYRIFDLNETVLFRSKKGINSFDVDIYSDKLLIATVDNDLILFSKNTTLPQNLEKIYAVEKEPVSQMPVEPHEKTTEDEKAVSKEDETISVSDQQTQEPATEQTQKDNTAEEHYDTSIDLSQVKKEDTKKSSEMEKTVTEEKEEEIAIVLDGKVIVGNLDDEKNTPIPTGEKSQRELTTEELQGLTAIYGGWKSAVAYKDYGYVLAGDTNMRIVNPLLQTIKNIQYSKSSLLDCAISKYNLLALLFDSRIEIWDVDNLYSTKDTSKINSYKFPISDGKEISFSRNGEYMLVLRDNGELKIMSLDFTRGKNIYSKNLITAIEADLTQNEHFLFGDEKGNVGIISTEGILSSKNCSDSPIIFVFSHKGKTYWVDENSTVGILDGIQRRITTEKIQAVYPADIDKDWIMFGTDKGNLYILNNTLTQIGKTSIPHPVRELSGYKENMISIDEFYNLKSWNLIAGSEISNKPHFTSTYGLFSDNNLLTIITTDHTIYSYTPNNDIVEKGALPYESFVVTDILKNPPVIHNEGKKYYPYSNKKISDFAIEVFEEGNVNSSERYFIYWDQDMLSVFDIKNSKTIRTFKFGDGNNIHFASMRKDRLFFFFNESMGITNPYNPGQLIVIDLENEGLSEIKRVFLIEGTKLGILDSTGKIIYYMLLEDRITLPIELGKVIDSALYDEKNLRVIAKSQNTLIVYNARDNNIAEYTFSEEIKDFTFTEQGIYVLSDNGIIWYK